MFGLGGFEFIGVILLLAVAIIIYFLPYIMARQRKNTNVGTVGVINLFLGWTFIGWVVALALAYSGKDKTKTKLTNCPYCKAEIDATAAKCQYCGEWIKKPTQE